MSTGIIGGTISELEGSGTIIVSPNPSSTGIV
jgi:hypothetical protein